MPTKAKDKKDEKKVPELRFPEFKGEWEEKTLGKFLEFKNGINAAKEQYGKGRKFINVLDIIENNYIIHDKIQGSVDISENEFKKNSVSYGDILFQRSSETREEVGQSNVYLDKEKKTTFGGFVIRGKKISEYNPHFFNYLLKTAKIRKDITSRSGGSTRFNIGQESLTKVQIQVPSLPEQQKIADFLTAVDEWIESLKAQKQKLEAYKKGLMQKIFTQQIRFKDDNGKNFPDWEEKGLSDICIKKSSNISANSLKKEKGNYVIYGANGIYRTVSFYSEKDPYIGIVKDGAGVGRTFLCEPKSSVLGTLDILKSSNNIKLSFLFNILNRIQFKKYIIGSTIPHIYFKDYKKEKVTVPTLQEQQKIADFLTIIDKLMGDTQNQIKRINKWKKALIQKLFV